jgi:hypothetical protein
MPPLTMPAQVIHAPEVRRRCRRFATVLSDLKCLANICAAGEPHHIGCQSTKIAIVRGLDPMFSSLFGMSSSLAQNDGKTKSRRRGTSSESINMDLRVNLQRGWRRWRQGAHPPTSVPTASVWQSSPLVPGARPSQSAAGLLGCGGAPAHAYMVSECFVWEGRMPSSVRRGSQV